MNLYLTFGTTDYLKKIVDEHSGQELRLLEEDSDKAILLHETDGERFFHEGHEYQVLDSVGSLQNGTFAVLNNIPVSDEGRSLFEHRFSKRAGLIESEPGFGAIRVLRPLDTDTYVILTLWNSEKDFSNWQSSNAYGQAHKKRGTSEGIDQQENIFPRPSYVTSYHAVN
ncbi:antibiotic biosynthesis monooxygenase family protein [Priestia koreensis]|uniref:ABM domain-containing protein n=1 Tax=Priestia koreensis TaxID=284581 RepID=A0A0M0LGX8_9BACI|nr:antibiotic biosynthesis monooxygenase [Priestia koreensis]KOO50226.1 hypothetical protein AMD01_00170 [Priestia koreensis]